MRPARPSHISKQDTLEEKSSSLWSTTPDARTPEDCVLVDCDCRGRIRRSRVLGIAAFLSANAEAAWKNRARRVGTWRAEADPDRVFFRPARDTPRTRHRAAQIDWHRGTGAHALFV